MLRIRSGQAARYNLSVIWVPQLAVSPLGRHPERAEVFSQESVDTPRRLHPAQRFEGVPLQRLEAGPKRGWGLWGAEEITLLSGRDLSGALRVLLSSQRAGYGLLSVWLCVCVCAFMCFYVQVWFPGVLKPLYMNYKILQLLRTIWLYTYKIRSWWVCVSKCVCVVDSAVCCYVAALEPKFFTRETLWLTSCWWLYVLSIKDN